MKQNHCITDNEIIESYTRHGTLGKMAVEFGVPDVTIWRRATKLGLSFDGRGKGKKIPLDDILLGKHPNYQSNKLRKRLISEGHFNNECFSCGISDWNGKDIVCQLDHIDGNTHNHLVDNLRLLCPNCHSQTSTYCGKNIPR